MGESDAAQVKAARMFREAREHKRASRRHRDRARELHQQLDEFIAACARRGIQVTINAQPEGGHGGNQNQNQDEQAARTVA